MEYSQYITKKRFRGKAICGDVNIPYGTICDVQGGYIYLDDKAICVTTSQNALDFFWGYDSSNPDEEIKRQKVARKLFDTAPNLSGDDLADKRNSWNQYGCLIEYSLGMFIWRWDEMVFDLSEEKLHYLLNCIEKGEMPLCIKL